MSESVSRFRICMNCYWVIPELRAWNWANIYEYEYVWITKGFEYALIYMNMFNRARILNMAESAEIYPNVGKYLSLSPALWIWLNMSKI